MEEKEAEESEKAFYLARPRARSRGVTRANLSNYLIVEHLVVARQCRINFNLITADTPTRDRPSRFPDEEPAGKYCRAA